ncbi:MAG: hypothetical protein JST04_02025 [Bdellovibrionales bacterium]|nr:hypothetical protein [Bdellovibrionales bacterium]
MIRALSLVSLALLATSAFAATTTYVYPVGSVKDLGANQYAVTTPKGLSVYLNCANASFDDSEHDWVSGFSSKEECESFVKKAKAHAGKGDAEIVLNNTALEMKITW